MSAKDVCSVKCCGKYANGYTCSKILNLSKKQFHQYQDCDGHIIYYYTANEYSLISNNMEQFFRHVYGEYVRIFCSRCIFYLKKCKYTDNNSHRCSNKDTQLIFIQILKRDIYNDQYMPYIYPYRICRNHAKCFLCTRRKPYQLITCKYCNKLFCKRKLCGLYREQLCKTCVPLLEIQHMMYVIQKDLNKMKFERIVDINIIHIIAKYSIGYVVNCCNKFDKCNNTIIIENKHQFQMKRDYQNYKIHYSVAKISHEKSNPTLTIYNKKIRIFCTYCSAHRLRECGKCYNKEAGIFKRVCSEHPLCSVCRTQNAVWKCSSCREMFCENHVDFEGGSCINCATRNEYRHIKIALICQFRRMKLNMSDKVIDIITESSMGIIVHCCSKNYSGRSYCISGPQTEIAIDNKRMFILKKDCNGFKIHICNSNPSFKDNPVAYGKTRQIFCSNCSIT
eukprot:148678_1